MKIFGYNLTKEKTATAEIRNYTPIAQTLRFALYGSADTAAMKSGVVYRCVNLISDSIASLPLIPYNYKDN